MLTLLQLRSRGRINHRDIFTVRFLLYGNSLPLSLSPSYLWDYSTTISDEGISDANFLAMLGERRARIQVQQARWETLSGMILWFWALLYMSAQIILYCYVNSHEKPVKSTFSPLISRYPFYEAITEAELRMADLSSIHARVTFPLSCKTRKSLEFLSGG